MAGNFPALTSKVNLCAALHQMFLEHNNFEEGARAPASGRGWPGPAGTVKINGKVLMAGAQL